jgi:hypothetical protein
MAYDDKAHRHEHQVKVRLDDEAFQELKDVDPSMWGCVYSSPLGPPAGCCWAGGMRVVS